MYISPNYRYIQDLDFKVQYKKIVFLTSSLRENQKPIFLCGPGGNRTHYLLIANEAFKPCKLQALTF